VNNRVIHGEDGEKGKPFWMTLDGKIQPDGAAFLSVRGLGGDRNTSLNREPPGTPFVWTVTARFDGVKGTGKRDAGRQCDVLFVRQ
jgi:hypothetical protein